MPSSTDRAGGEIDWPDQFNRTPRGERRQTTKFSVTFTQAAQRLRNELLERVDADDWRLSTAAPARKKDGLPYAGADPTDPGVVVRWSKAGEKFAVACDHYDDWRDNVRAIGLYVREKRKMAGRPVTTGQSEFATAKLPSGDETGGAATTASPAHEILEVAPDADPAVIQAAARQKIKETHPDQGGDPEAFRQVREARDEMLEDR